LADESENCSATSLSILIGLERQQNQKLKSKEIKEKEVRRCRRFIEIDFMAEDSRATSIGSLKEIPNLGHNSSEILPVRRKCTPTLSTIPVRVQKIE
jgi:hypothetical protein